MIDQALSFISPDCERGQWVKYLMAIKSEAGDTGREIAETWSQQSEKFKQADFEATWRSINTTGGITAGTLFHEARRNGWTGKAEPRPIHKPVKTLPPKTLPYALEIWERVKPGDFESLDSKVSAHPYAINKGITWAAGAARGAVSGRLIGQGADCLIVPQRAYPAGEICGIEAINSDGKKQTFGSKGVLILGNDLDANLPQLVCEGWATGVEHFRLFEGNICIYVAGAKALMPRVAKAIIEHTGRAVIQRGENDE